MNASKTVETRAFDLDVTREELPTFPEKFEEFSGTMQPTYSGFSPDECSSGLQKAIRRGWFRDAFQNGLELYRSGPLLRTNVWNRLIIISFEDVGLADPFAIVDVYHLFKKRGTSEEELSLLTAIFRLCQAKKSRINDNSVYMYPQNGIFKGSVSTWEDDLIEALEKKVIGFAHYYRQAIANCEEKIKINGKGRGLNPQTLIWSAFQKVLPDSDYLKLIREISMLPNHKWKAGTQMYQTHCINLICLGIVPTNEELKNHKPVDLLKDFQVYLDEHKERKNIKGICDYAIDKHTRKGRSKNRLFIHFFEEGAKLYNEDKRFMKLSAKFFSDLKKNMKEIGTWK